MKRYLLTHPDEELKFIWRDNKWWADDEKSLSYKDMDLFFHRVEHTRKWCAQHNTSFTFEQTLFAENSNQVHTRRIDIFKAKDSMYNMVIKPMQHIEDILFHSDYDTRLLDSMSDALLITEADIIDEPGPRIVYVNKAYERMTGYKVKNVLGENPRIFQGIDSSNEAKQNIRNALHRWECITQRIVNYKKDGTPYLVELNISPVKDITGWYTHWISVQRDISQERDNLNAYIGSELALHAVGFGTWWWELDSESMVWDSRMFEIYQIEEHCSYIAFQDWAQTLHPEDRSKVLAKMRLAAAEGGDWDITYRIITPLNETKYIRSRARVSENPVDKRQRMIGINWDITKEMLAYLEAENQREIANRNAKLASLGQFAAGVGHEINNPLSIISVLADYLKVKAIGSGVESQELIETCDKILGATNRVTKIVKGLKSISRDKDEKLNISPLNLFESLQDTLDLFVEINSQRGLEIEVTHCPTDACAIAEHSSLQQIVVNLLANASDAVKSLPNAKITVSLAEIENMWRFTIEDNGPGIPKHIQAKIFEPFVTSKQVGRGTGLGLSISKSLAERMGGQLSYETSLDGTSFHLDLQAVQASSDALANANKVKPCRVLIVEDDNMVSDSIGQIFGLFDCELSFAQNGKEGVSCIQQEPAFDVILTDMRMPIMDGYEFLNVIIEMEQVEHAKVYTLTGDASSFTKEQRRQISRISDGWLEKPLRYQVIEKILTEVRSNTLH